MNCDCKNFVSMLPSDIGQHHHTKCEKYKTEKFPTLFYYTDALDFWTPAPKLVDDLLSVTDQMTTDENVEIEFKRIDLTDEEFDNMPAE